MFNVPKLRFGEFEGEWVEKRLKDYILSHKGGASLKPKDFVKKSNSEVIPKKAIVNNGKLNLDKENPTFCSDDFFKANQKSVIDNKYLITTLRDLVPSGPNIGYIVKNYFSKKFILAQGVYGLEINQELDENFLILLSNRIEYRRVMQRIMVGSTQVHIRNKDFFSIKINLPTLQEQQKIATYLTSIDKKIEQLNQKRTLLESYKKGVMQKIFSQEIRFKRDDGGFFEDWEEKRLFDCFKEVLDFRGRTPLKMGMNWGNGNIISLSANNVKNGYIDFNTECNLGSEELYEKWMGKVNLDKNDIVFTMEAPLGKALLIPDDRKYILSQRVVAFKTNEKINNKFLIQIIWSKKFQNEITKLSTGSTAKGINQKSLKRVNIKLPQLAEQQKISNFLTSIDQKITQNNQALEEIRAFKKGLLQQMFV